MLEILDRNSRFSALERAKRTPPRQTTDDPEYEHPIVIPPKCADHTGKTERRELLGIACPRNALGEERC